MTRLFRSKSCGFFGLNPTPSPIPYYDNGTEDEEEEEEKEEDEESEIEDEEDGTGYNNRITENPISAPFIGRGQNGNSSQHGGDGGGGDNGFAVMDILVAVLRKSLVTCSVERDDTMDISWPTEVRHVSHVTFDRFNGFLGLPSELEPEVPRKVPSASVSVFGVSAKSMQCSYDPRGNSVPTILLMMQKHLYVEGGLKAEGIFRINAENGQEEDVREQLNKGIVPTGIDVHCLAGLIKAWFRELPGGVLDSLAPEQVMISNSEEDCTELVKILPPTESAILDWAINLMADVVEHEQFNKMNSHNIAMVFAPNMTQMADPLTALIHAVQVMNFLKTLILKTLRERKDAATPEKCVDLSNLRIEDKSCKQTVEPSTKLQCTNKFLRTATLGRLESSSSEERLWSFRRKSDDDGEEESVTNSGGRTSPAHDGGDNWLSLRKGVRRLCRHPVFQLTKPSKKAYFAQHINLIFPFLFSQAIPRTSSMAPPPRKPIWVLLLCSDEKQKGILDFFKKPDPKRQKVETPPFVENPNSSAPPIPKSQATNVNNSFDINSLVRDPGVRQQIWKYDFNKQDEVRRAYIRAGPFQCILAEYPKTGKNIEGVFNRNGIRNFQRGWNIL
ncbi:rho GTPase-activating protein 3-like [Rutidosis leptorrhynchoides]|uniref:rho GTPase-activating protein 3-like n=1 Tax=Rutidosis leptorrhynchoides TaxID=125765 RepID=UPI003A9A38C2